MASRGPCFCSLCVLDTYEDDDGVAHPGSLQTARDRLQHQIRDSKREKRHARQAARVEAEILVTTMENRPSSDTWLREHREDHQRPFLNVSTIPNQAPYEQEDDTSYDTEPASPCPQDRLQPFSEPDLMLKELKGSTNLVFSRPPTLFSDPIPPLADGVDINVKFVTLLSWLQQEHDRITDVLNPLRHKDADRRREKLLQRFRHQIERLERLKRHCWDRAKVTAGVPGLYLLPDKRDPIIVHPSPIARTRRNMHPFLIAALIMVTALHTLAGVARPYASFALATIKVVILGTILTVRGPSNLTSEQKALLDKVPEDVRTAAKFLDLAPDIISYACCPKCFAIYLPDVSQPDDPYPRTCTHQETDLPVCGEPLVAEKILKPIKKGCSPRSVFRAIRTYPYRSLKSWVSDLMSRSGIPALLRDSWDRSNVDNVESWNDIMDAPAIRAFTGPDGRNFSIQAPGSVHLVFSLFIDWFNPHGNKQAGRKHSVGAIYLACLNLPPHLRYRPENIYLAGIIPGIREPRFDELNHLLRPLVDELLEFWDRGIYFNGASLGSAGYYVRAAVIPLVCDIPALRKAAGFASHSANRFCSFCRLLKEDISNLNRETWPEPFTWVEHLFSARAWRDALTDEARLKAFKQHGIRWSELLRLPYWNPTQYPLLDSMHNLFLGELKHHCMTIWGLASAEGRPAPGETRKGSALVHSPEQQQDVLDRIVSALRKGSLSAVTAIRKDYLSVVAEYNGITVGGSNPTKKDYATRLMEFVSAAASRGGMDALRLPPILPYATSNFHILTNTNAKEEARSFTSVFSGDVLEAIRRDMTMTHLPSHIDRPPAELGSPGTGKLKADHWRTLCTVNMVITLARLWGAPAASDEEKSVLDNFLHLVAAVDLATRRTMSSSRAHAFDHHIEAYLRGLLTLYDAQLVPNHHLSLHLKDFLLLFGPTHGWWSFPFERYNGIIQRLKTNNKPSEIPSTFMHSFYVGSRLRWLMDTESWPSTPEYEGMLKSFKSAFQDAVHGSRLMNALSSTQEVSSDLPSIPEHLPAVEQPFKLPPHIYHILLAMINAQSQDGFASLYNHDNDVLPFLSDTVDIVSRITCRGLTYATRRRSGIRNSHVLFRVASSSGFTRIVPGQIDTIFCHTRKEGDVTVNEPFLILDEYAPLSAVHQSQDPYVNFPDIDTRLFYNRFTGTKHLVRVEDISSHFAAYVYTPPGIEEECVVVRSLDRN